MTTAGASSSQGSSLGTVILIVGALLAIVGGVLLGLGLSSQGALDRIRAAQPATLAALASGSGPAGTVKLTATIGTEAPATLPGEGEKVVYGQIRITARYREVTTGPSGSTSSSTNTRTLYDRTVRAERAHLEDGGARVAIAPEALAGAAIDGREVRTQIFAANNRSYFTSTIDYGTISASIARSGGSDIVEAPTVTKHLVEPGARVFVIGEVVRQGESPVLVAPAGDSLRIYARDERTVENELAASAAWMVPFGGAVLGLGVLGLLGGVVGLVTARGG